MQLTARPSRLFVAGTVLLAPIAGVVVLKAPLFNNLVYRDPWFYSGYGWTLTHHIEIFGWFYYAVRFPVTLPIGWTTDLFGPVTGYLVLRYAILAGTGAVLYACVRRFSSAGVATAAVLLLAFNPYYVRMVLWDYTSYVALPCAIAGVALWLMSSTRGRVFWPFVASGALLTASAFANALSVSFVVPLVAVEVIGSIRRGPAEIGRLVLRTASAAVGAVAVFVSGYLGYRYSIGAFSPRELVQPTIDFIRSNDQLAAPLQRPVSEFLEGEPRIYAPPLLCLAMVIALGRRLLEDSLRGRLAQYALGYVALLWLYRFAVTSSVLETWWAYNMAAISMCFAAPVILDELVRRTSEQRARMALVAVLLGTAVTTFAIRSANASAVDAYERVRDNVPLLLALLGLGALTAVAMKAARDERARAVAAAAFFAVVTIVSLMPARYIGIGQTGEFAPDGRGEVLAYQAAYDMAKLLEGPDQPDSRILLWTTLSGLPMIAWTNLPHQFSSVQSPDAPIPALNDLSPQAEDLVRHPTTDALLLLSEDPADMTRGVAELRREGVRPQVVSGGTWADGHLHYALVDVRGPAQCCDQPDEDRHAAAIVAQAYLDAHTARDASAICRIVAPEVQLTIAAGQPSCAAVLQPQLARRYRHLRVGGTSVVPSPPGNPRIAVEVRDQPGRRMVVGRYGSIWRVVDGGKVPV